MAKKTLTIVAKTKDEASKRLAKIGKKFPKLGKAMSAIGKVAPFAAAGVAAIGGAAVIAGKQLFDMTSQLAQQGDQFAKYSEKVGVSTEMISAWTFAAEKSGVSMETFQMALQRMTRRVSEFVDLGAGEAKGALEELGLEADLMSGRLQGQEDILLAIADAFEKLDDEATKTRLAMKLFDSEGVSLIQILDQGREAIEAMIDEAHELGIVWSEEDAAAAVELADAQAELAASWEGLRKTLLIDLIPILEDFTDTIKEIVNFVRESDIIVPLFFGAIEGALEGLLGPLGTVIGLFEDLLDLFDEVEQKEALLPPEIDITGEFVKAGIIKPKRKIRRSRKKAGKSSAQIAAEEEAKAREEARQWLIDGEIEFNRKQEELRFERLQQVREDEQRRRELASEFLVSLKSEHELELEAIRLQNEEVRALREEGLLSQQETADLQKELRDRELNEMFKQADSVAASLGQIGVAFGKGAQIQALVQIPLEIAKAARDIADSATAFASGNFVQGLAFAGSAASHFQAVKALKKAAKGGGGAEGGGGVRARGGAGAGAREIPGRETQLPTRGRGTAIVRVPEGVVTDSKRFAKEVLERFNDATDLDWNIDVVQAA